MSDYGLTAIDIETTAKVGRVPALDIETIQHHRTQHPGSIDHVQARNQAWTDVSAQRGWPDGRVSLGAIRFIPREPAVEGDTTSKLETDRPVPAWAHRIVRAGGHSKFLPGDRADQG